MGRVLKLPFAVTVVSISALLLQGCGANDVSFNVTISNNTDHTVVDHGYFETQAEELKPGQSLDEAEFPNEGVDQDRITTPSGHVLGCLPFQFSEIPPIELRVNLIEMVPCRNWGNPSGNSKYDWPNRSY